MSKRIIYWFRNDLRLQDNEAFWEAVGAADELLPVYVFDPRRFRSRYPGFRKTGLSRAMNLLEGVRVLQREVREKGGNLMIKVGEPEKIVAELARIYEVEEVRASKEITLEEANIEASLSKKLKGINVDISLTWMSTLIHPHDLPFYISRLPSRYATFREEVKGLPIRHTVGEQVFRQLEVEEEYFLPELKVLGFSAEEVAKRHLTVTLEPDIRVRIQNGTASLESVLGAISFGAISPREAYQLTNGSEIGDRLYRKLLWRDYLLFVALRYGSRLFKPSGLAHQVDRAWKNDQELFFKWAEGRTEEERINSYMRALSDTGDLSFEESRAAAKYLAIDLGVNWTWGASWFECHLKEHEVALNWGNWNYFVGVGLEGDPETP